MVPLIYLQYHGEVEIAYWEYLLAALYILFFYLYFSRRKNLMVKRAPEYKYYMSGLMIKILGGAFFSLIYFYYYQGGDTTTYFFSGVAMRNLALVDPLEYLYQIMGNHGMREWSVYTLDTAKPFKYVFFDDRTFVVLVFTSILAFFTFNSYLVSTLVLASLSYFGVWACYRTFVGYFPQLAGRMAIGFLFMPSSVFWGSAILKDTFTFSAVCWWVHAVDEVFFKHRGQFMNWLTIVLSAWIMLLIKPYIFMVMMPATLLWLFYFRVSRLRNAMIKFVVVPITVVGLAAMSFFLLIKLGSQLDKFALTDALTTIQVTQADLANEASYGSNSFDLGYFDGTWSNILMKFPLAVNAALFRPYIWESRNLVMGLSGLENLWVLGLVAFAFLRSGPFFVFRAMGGVPLLLMSMVFALLFAFIVGVTTPNFGALVRFKIPMVPFFISSVYIIVYLGELKREAARRGDRFNIREFRLGTAHVVDELTRARNVRNRASRNRRGSDGRVQLASL